MKPTLFGFLFVTALSPRAFALEPLSVFLHSARTTSFDTREAKATAEARTAQARAVSQKLWPILTARGAYTFNQYEAIVSAGTPPRTATIVPQHQLDATLSAELPLIDFSAWSRARAANALEDAAGERVSAAKLEVEGQVARAYYGLIAARAVEQAALRQVGTAQASLSLVELRQTVGTATVLELERAKAETERAKQAHAHAGYLTKVAERLLETLSGRKPDAGTVVLEDPLTPPPLQSDSQAPRPLVRALTHEERAQRESASLGGSGFLPILSATASERFTNATGFQGRSALFTAGAALTWRLDLSTLSQSSADGALALATRVRRERQVRQDEDALHNAHHLVISRVVECRAARAESKASSIAAKVAKERYEAGNLLQLDLLEAERQAFASEVVRIKAESDLAEARASLRIAQGKPLLGPDLPGTTQP